MSSFELDKPDWYTVALAEENEWLNARLENHNYGIYYSVVFQGNAETYLWQTKTAPERDKAYYGHTYRAKSGKSMRFSTDKVPEGVSPPDSTPKEVNEKQSQFLTSDDKQHAISKSVALHNSVLFHQGDEKKTSQDVLNTANVFLEWLDPPKIEGDEFSLKDVPDFGEEDER